MGEAREYLCIKVANQSSLFKDGVVSTQNGDEGDLHDHINKFNQLVSQLLNANDKLSEEEHVLC